MANEEEEMLEEEEETEESEEKTEETKVTIDFNLDPIERIQIEIENAKNNNEKLVGNFLKEQFEKDEALKNCYRDRKITLSNTWKFVMDCAAKQLNRKDGALTSEVVFGWVLHYVQDEPVKIVESESYQLTKEDKDAARTKALKQYEKEELEKIRKKEQKEKAAKEKAIAKEKAKREASGQMSLFEDSEYAGL